MPNSAPFASAALSGSNPSAAAELVRGDANDWRTFRIPVDAIYCVTCRVMSEDVGNVTISRPHLFEP